MKYLYFLFIISVLGCDSDIDQLPEVCPDSSSIVAYANAVAGQTVLIDHIHDLADQNPVMTNDQLISLVLSDINSGNIQVDLPLIASTFSAVVDDHINEVFDLEVCQNNFSQLLSQNILVAQSRASTSDSNQGGDLICYKNFDAEVAGFTATASICALGGGSLPVCGLILAVGIGVSYAKYENCLRDRYGG